jgi:hypothetical protein
MYVSKSKSTNGVTAMGFDFKDAITITTYVLGLQYTFLVINHQYLISSDLNVFNVKHIYYAA